MSIYVLIITLKNNMAIFGWNETKAKTISQLHCNLDFCIFYYLRFRLTSTHLMVSSRRRSWTSAMLEVSQAAA